MSLVNTHVPVTCVLSAFNTQLAYNRVFARVRGELSRGGSDSLLSPVYGQFSRPFSLSSLFPTLVSLFLAFLSPPQHSLFLVLYVHYTNNSSSVSTETSLPAPRPSHSLLLLSFFPLSLFSPILLTSTLSLISFSFSFLVNHAVLSSPPEPALVSEFYLNVLIRARARARLRSV